MTTYLSGPMSGYEDNNLPVFHAAAAKLREAGWEVVNPAELDTHDPEVGGWEQYLRRDLRAIVRDCDSMVTLPGWHASRGATLEVHVARALGMPVFTLAQALGEQPPLIGLCGFAGVGKDATARSLARHGYVRVAFADALRDVLYDTNPIAEGVCDYPVGYYVDEWGWDRAKREIYEIRGYLQRLGVAVRDHVSESAWVDAALRKADASHAPVAITDVRFDNEVEAVRSRGGLIVLVTRPGHAAVNDHVSEQLAASLEADRTLADHVIDNDGGPEALDGKVDGLVESIS
ncbi:MAG: DUF4406 domain-containing protein [Nitriliruptorales bacterium]